MNIITIKTTENFHAGQKAPSDIIEILKKEYNVRTTFFDELPTNKILKKLTKRLNYTYQFLKSRIKNEVVLLQFPFPETSKILNPIFLFNMKLLNKKKTIALIHDLNGLRYQDDYINQVEIKRLKKLKYIIVHNDIMKQKLIDNGIDKFNLYVLELFDYLCDEMDLSKKDKKTNKKNFKVVYAGNLAKGKSPFIHEIKDNKINYTMNLYGIGIDKDISKKIIYKDKYPAEILPSKLDGDLGLIWDGLATEEDSNIGMKNYTKINNPHKMSCYMAAGLPVIVWNKSAISKFVKKYDLGYTINTIEDINKIDLKDYEKKLENVLKIREKVINGYYTKRVVEKILKEMGEL